MAKDVTDATFDTEVMARSVELPVVVDLWAPWCQPCRTLGPILERSIEATGGKVELAKVNIDENPRVAAAFRTQSIPAVFAVQDGRVVANFVGAIPEAEVKAFVDQLASPPSEADMLAEQGDEESLRQALELQPDHAGAVVALAQLLTDRGDHQAALDLLARIPDSPESRRVAAAARLGMAGEAVGTQAAGGAAGSAAAAGGTSIEARLDELLEKVREDEEARQLVVDILETMEPDDPRRSRYRRALASRLF